MAISKIKLITIVSARGGDTSNVGVELNINGGGNAESVTGQTQGAVKETVIQFNEPIDRPNFTLELFNLYVGSLSSASAWLLLESIYVVDASPGSSGQLLLGIPNWPQNLWLCSEPQTISGGYTITGCNLGVIAKMTT